MAEPWRFKKDLDNAERFLRSIRERGYSGSMIDTQIASAKFWIAKAEKTLKEERGE